MVSVTTVVEEVGVNPKKVTVDLESEEVPGRGSDCEEPRGLRRPGVFRGEWATVVATPAESSGKDGGPGEFCIFFKLSNSGLVLGAGGEVGAEAVPAVGRVKVKG